jgi:hypothetical protein
VGSERLVRKSSQLVFVVAFDSIRRPARAIRRSA